MKHLHFSTVHEDACDKIEAWGQLTSRFFGNLRVASLDNSTLDATLDAYEVGPMRMFYIETPAHQVQHDRTCGELPTDDFYKLVLQLRGRAFIHQRDRSFHLQPGDWSLYDPQVPYSITNYDRATLLVVQVPRQKLKGFKVPNLHTCEARNSGVAGLHTVFASYLRSLSEQLPRLPDGVGQTVGESVLGLLASTLFDYQDRGSEHPALPVVLRQRVMQYIQTHLAEPDLSIERIALAMHCSKRYLHFVFEGDDCSLERHIWLTRLERCMAALRAEGNQLRSISEVAFACGFSSSAHFSRMFKAQFGMPPSEYRKHSTATQNGQSVCH